MQDKGKKTSFKVIFINQFVSVDQLLESLQPVLTFVTLDAKSSAGASVVLASVVVVSCEGYKCFMALK